MHQDDYVLPHGHALLEFFEPVDVDVDLFGGSFAGYCRCGQQYDETFAIRHNSKAATALVRLDSLYRQRCWFAKGEGRMCLYIDGNDSGCSGNFVRRVEELSAVRRP